MTKRDHLSGLFATFSVVTASAVYAAPFLMIGAWLTGVH